jgi:hypothetical protein
VELNQIQFVKQQRQGVNEEDNMTAKKTSKAKKSKKVQKEEQVVPESNEQNITQSEIVQDEEVKPAVKAKPQNKQKSSKSVPFLTAVMNELKVQNPMATWKNVFLGFAVVMLVVASSLIYFNKLAANSVVQDSTKEIETQKPAAPKTETPEVKVEKDEYTTVLEGEGLWNVAERVCNDGEKYVVLAEANDLNSESAVSAGQKLLVKCN